MNKKKNQKKQSSYKKWNLKYIYVVPTTLNLVI